MTIRPYGIVIDGHLELGLEVVMDGARVVEVRPHTGIPDPFVLSPAFVNAHSHMEYRGLMGVIDEPSYWPWIREITRLKAQQSPEAVRQDCLTAAAENVRAGVAIVAEHSDRPFAGEAMASAGLDGVLYQEVITFAEQDARHDKLARIERAATENARHFTGPIYRAPHAIYTVDDATLREIGEGGLPFSIHVAETEAERELVRHGTGIIAEFWKLHGRRFPLSAPTVLQALAELGMMRRGAQFVHCCDIDEDEVASLAECGVSVAHCPRSNVRLRCPVAPVRQMLDAGVQVGLGLDSAASSGPIDMFAEMRAALEVAEEVGAPLHPEEVWRMATQGGYASLPEAARTLPRWAIEPGSETPMIAINVPGAQHVEDLIRQARPDLVVRATGHNREHSSV